MKALTILVLSFVFAVCLGGCSKEAASIGVIGGADGPTAIFVASRMNWLHICGLIGSIIVVIVAALVIYRNKNKK